MELNTNGYISTFPYESFYVRNNQIAVEPFKTDAIEPKINKGFGTVAQKTTLTGLTVVYGNGDIHVGDTVYVPGDLCAHGTAKQVFEIEEGKSFILISLDNVKIVRRANWSPPGTVTWAAPGGTMPVTVSDVGTKSNV